MLKHDRDLYFRPLMRLFLLIRLYDKFSDQLSFNAIQCAIGDCLQLGCDQDLVNKIVTSDQKSSFLKLINWSL